MRYHIEPCPVCKSDELFDATTTSDHPTQYAEYPAFRGHLKRRVYCCFNCKSIVPFLMNDYGKFEMQEPTFRNPSFAGDS